VSSATALRLSLAALVVSLLCFVVNGAVYWLHVPIALPPQVLTVVGVLGLTWPLWAYAVAMYRRALTK
jgi:hypothetical protein